MPRTLTKLVVGVALLAGLAHAAPSTRPALDVAPLSWAPHGEPTATPEVLENEFVTIEQVLADPAKLADEEVTVVGRISDVCSKAGCWIKLQPLDADVHAPTAKGLDTKSVFVKLVCQSDGFLVPVESKGQVAFARGKVVVEQVDEATARHYAEDAGASDEDVAAIVGEQTTIRLMTPGVHVAEQ